VPTVEITLDMERMSATALCLKLQRGEPAIALDPASRDKGVVTVNPMCLKPGEAEIVGREIARALGARSPA
jgi:hypothetical protein